MHVFGMEGTRFTYPCFIVEANGIDDEGVSLPLRNRMAEECRYIRHRPMRSAIGGYDPVTVKVFVKNDQPVIGLYELHRHRYSWLPQYSPGFAAQHRIVLRRQLPNTQHCFWTIRR